ncbi:MAG TPA: hypothetical protein DCR93_20640 [Cytophagales bacterium]|nr:hypothetical protein [Cytophagales bacterium]HAP61801.1 hypothetical protein [Cytophagales bacterium]
MNKSWHDTLLDYYSLSNEIERNTDLCKRLTLELERPISWLDIGSGDGSKILSLVKELHFSLPGYTSLHLSEPSETWRNSLVSSSVIEELQLYGEVNLSSRTLSSWGRHLIKDEFSLITIVHVVYGQDRLKDFIDFSKLAREKLKGGILWVVVEAEDSAFNIMRQQLIHRNILLDPSQYREIDTFLKQEGFNYAITKTDGKQCNISETDPQNWLPPFLLGIEGDEYQELPADKKRIVERIVSDHCNHRKVLEIDDIAFTIRL